MNYSPLITITQILSVTNQFTLPHNNMSRESVTREWGQSADDWGGIIIIIIVTIIVTIIIISL